mmetsp:Transcript_13594/g.31267  ORF Transcript_13594/g.31267 Transcript_13594/m.31267 type:complete len:204 (-) Transcript_13594:709-1320(-)
MLAFLERPDSLLDCSSDCKLDQLVSSRTISLVLILSGSSFLWLLRLTLHIGSLILASHGLIWGRRRSWGLWLLRCGRINAFVIFQSLLPSRKEIVNRFFRCCVPFCALPFVCTVRILCIFQAILCLLEHNIKSIPGGFANAIESPIRGNLHQNFVDLPRDLNQVIDRKVVLRFVQVQGVSLLWKIGDYHPKVFCHPHRSLHRS